MTTIPMPVVAVAGSVVAGAVVAPVTILLAGFGTGGVVAGSIAAGAQAAIGNVAAGSTFAFLQSLGTTPLLSALYGGLSSGVAAGGGVGAAALVQNADIIVGGARLVAGGVAGTINVGAIVHQISQGTGILAGPAQDALVGMLGGQPISEVTIKGVISAIEGLNLTPVAHHVIGNIVGNGKLAIGVALWRMASSIRG